MESPSCTPASPPQILPIEFLRALQSGSPTPQSRARPQPCRPRPKPLPLCSQRAPNVPHASSQLVWNNPSTPLSPAFIAGNPITPIMHTSFSGESYFLCLSDRSGALNSAGPNSLERYQRSSSQDQSDNEDAAISVQYDYAETPKSGSTNQSPYLLPYHVLFWAENGAQIMIPPSHPEWRDLWAALHNHTNGTLPLPSGSYAWKDTTGAENVRHIAEAPTLEGDKRPYPPQECPLPPHLADLPNGHVAMSSSSDEEEIFTPDTSFAQLLLEAPHEDSWDEALPPESIFRWRDYDGRTFVFRTCSRLPAAQQAPPSLSISSDDSYTDSDVSSIGNAVEPYFASAPSTPSLCDATQRCGSPHHGASEILVPFAGSCSTESSTLAHVKSPPAMLSHSRTYMGLMGALVSDAATRVSPSVLGEATSVSVTLVQG